MYWVSCWHRLSGLVNLYMCLDHSQSSYHSYHHLQYNSSYTYIADLEFGPGSNNRGVTVSPLVHTNSFQLLWRGGGGACFIAMETPVLKLKSIKVFEF